VERLGDAIAEQGLSGMYANKEQWHDVLLRSGVVYLLLETAKAITEALINMAGTAAVVSGVKLIEE